MKNTLTPVVVQDVRTNNVLMLAYADPRALAATRKTGFMHYWSRSRNKLWKKGETSGHVQRLVRLLHDCDRDALLARVEQSGPACHLGRTSCFSSREFRARGIFDELWKIFEDRRQRPRKGSYTTSLLRNPLKLAQKVLEEAAELAVAARKGHKREIRWEAADLLYHTLLLLFRSGVTLEEVEQELKRRRHQRSPSSRTKWRHNS